MSRSTQDIINLTRIGMRDGGSQTACSFLQQLSEQASPKDYIVVAFNNSDAGRLSAALGFDNIMIHRNVRERARFDMCCRRFFGKGQLCFTFHGVPWCRAKDYLLNVSGVADSNLYYPEIPFWKHLSVRGQALKYLKDRGRMLGYSRADYWIFETEVLARRAIDLAGYPQNRVATVKMSTSTFVSPEKVTSEVRDHFKQRIGDGFSLLFMAGANPNKRIIHAGNAVADMRTRRITTTPVKIVTTLDPRSDYYRMIQQEFSRLQVEDAWVNLGQVAFDQIPSLIDACDVICLFSVLESFSSNFTEAWAMRKPLLVSDLDWARSACGKAAMYVSPENASELADAIVLLMRPSVQARLLKEYTSHFNTYPTAQERCRQYLDCIETARRLGNISRKDSSRIKRFTCGRIKNAHSISSHPVSRGGIGI